MSRPWTFVIYTFMYKDSIQIVNFSSSLHGSSFCSNILIGVLYLLIWNFICCSSTFSLFLVTWKEKVFPISISKYHIARFARIFPNTNFCRKIKLQSFFWLVVRIFYFIIFATNILFIFALPSLLLNTPSLIVGCVFL